MYTPKAIGFDLFNTLMTIHPQALEDARQELITVLLEENVHVDEELFHNEYVEAAKRFLQETRKEGRETHNRYWIASALERLGYRFSPEDAVIQKAVEAYFSTFAPHCHIISDTLEILGQLAERYRLGLLTNFTDPPAVQVIIDHLGLTPFFHTILISGELGYRKPHPYVFTQLVNQLGVKAEHILFIGDDLDADVHGAEKAGLQPVLTTTVQAHNLPSAQTPLSPILTECPPTVPQISCWQDLLALLGE